MEQSGTPARCLPVDICVMTKERFAAKAGLEVGAVRGMIDRGHLPTIKIGRHRLVNVALLQAWCLADAGANAVEDGELPRH